ncbi:phosphotransferase [Microbacterium oxydans]|uniref:phosphotransferase family protein n=1 Tax=Microbacterium TaxID=33882 RepID=UPI00187D67EF|nr:phosphotransferase [Microbacterium sp. R1]MBE7956380.1 phosphotransferase [Microbacterium sp. R1]
MNALKTAKAPKEIPVEVLRSAARVGGRLKGFEWLGGLSGRSVAALHGVSASVVVKGPAVAAEVEIAGRLAGDFERHGIRTPTIFAIVETSSAGTWLVMERLPHPLPQERWGVDLQVIDTLRSLHSLPQGLVASLRYGFQPGWDSAMTRSAVSALHADAATAQHLEDLERCAQPLFARRCVISGDPNPLNWRVDHAGFPVLLDLERLTIASPALDLAILLPGLPDRSEAEALTSAYGPDSPSVDEILWAKAWTVVEMASTSAASRQARDVLRAVRGAFLAWLEQV